MDKILLLKPFIKKLSDSSFFKKCFFWILRAIAVFTLIGFIYVSFKLLSLLENVSMLPGEIIAIIFIAEIIMLILTFIIINIILVRADDIMALPDANDYVASPVVIILIKMTGEIFLTVFALLGVVSGIAMFAIGKQMGNLSGIPVAGFLADFGGAAVIIGPLYGFMMLATFYASAELISFLMDIARNTKR